MRSARLHTRGGEPRSTGAFLRSVELFEHGCFSASWRRRSTSPACRAARVRLFTSSAAVCAAVTDAQALQAILALYAA